MKVDMVNQQRLYGSEKLFSNFLQDWNINNFICETFVNFRLYEKKFMDIYITVKHPKCNTISS